MNTVKIKINGFDVEGTTEQLRRFLGTVVASKTTSDTVAPKRTYKKRKFGRGVTKGSYIPREYIANAEEKLKRIVQASGYNRTSSMLGIDKTTVYSRIIDGKSYSAVGKNMHEGLYKRINEVYSELGLDK